MRLVGESLTTAGVPDLDTTLAHLKALYRTPDGHTHQEVDEAGEKLLSEFYEAVFEKIASLELPDTIELRIEKVTGAGAPSQAGYRVIRAGNGFHLRLAAKSSSPAAAAIQPTFQIEIPGAGTGRDHDLVIVGVGVPERIPAQMSELVPTIGSGLMMRLRLAAERTVGMLLSTLLSGATNTFQQWMKG